jgi:hypothetical protein
MLTPEYGNRDKIMWSTSQPETHEVLLTVRHCAVVVSYASRLVGSGFCTQLGDGIFRGFS